MTPSAIAPRFAALIAIVVIGCATRPPCPTLPVTTTGSPWLWRVQHDDGPVLWLYGTLHNAAADQVPAAAWTALSSSPRFGSELGDVEPDPDLLHRAARLPRGPGLDAVLSADDWWDLSDALMSIINPDDLRRVRPWYAMVLLTKRMAPSPSPIMDVALTDRAHELHHPIDPLETWDQQLAVLTNGVTVTDLHIAIAARSTMRCDLARLDAGYRSGDAATMIGQLSVDSSARLLADRNQRWLPMLEAYLTTGGGFVAVGLSHLLGDDGLPNLLAARGYHVERVIDR
jgi:uncharacterized protein